MYDVNIEVEPERQPPAKCGQTMTEYALILAAIAIVALVAYTTLGTTLVTLVNNIIACM
jgi:Flp pilus assembly pilin Flp